MLRLVEQGSAEEKSAKSKREKRWGEVIRRREKSVNVFETIRLNRKYIMREIREK